MINIPMYHPLRDAVPPPGTDFTMASVERRGHKVITASKMPGCQDSTDKKGQLVWVPSYFIYRIERDGRVIARPPRPTGLTREYSNMGELLDLWMAVNRQHIINQGDSNEHTNVQPIQER